MQVWRLSKARFAHAAFSGEGARLFSGRWNPAGVRMVYTATSLALAAVELFVHLDPTEAPDDLVLTAATIPPDLTIHRLEIQSLPAGWREIDHPTLRRIGADWIASGKSVALEVPSVAVRGDWNVLLNPAHPDFPRITLHRPTPWSFDRRMFKKAP